MRAPHRPAEEGAMHVIYLVRAALALALVCAWLAALAFVRLKGALERLHLVTFVNFVAGGAVLVAVWLADGATARAWKSLLVWIVMLLSGALLSHASGRALLVRQRRRP